MSPKEQIVFLLGIGLIIFIVFLKNSDNLFQSNQEPVIIGITKPSTDTTPATEDANPAFPSIDAIIDIPAFELSSVENPEENLNTLVEKLNSAMQEESFFAPESDNALVYLLKLKNYELSEESLLKLMNDTENQLIEQLLNDSDTAFQNSDESLFEQSISRLKTLNVKKSKIQELKDQLAKIKVLNQLYAKATEMIEQGHEFSETGETIFQIAMQVKNSNIDNNQSREIIDTISNTLAEEALRAAQESYFQISNQTLAKVEDLNPDSQVFQDTSAKIFNIKQQRFSWLERQIVKTIKNTDIAATERIFSQIKDLELSPALNKNFQQEINRMKTYGAYAPLQEFYPDDDTNLPEMVVIKTGRFNMGKANGAKHEGPVHQVQINYGFAVSKNEITVGQFKEFVEATGYKTDAERNKSSRVYDLKTGRMKAKKRTHWRHDFSGKRAKNNEPVIHISWNDTQAYLNWLNQKTGLSFRLLSEAEFEYVLRAGTNSLYPWGDQAPTDIIENLTGKNDKARGNTYIRWTDGFDNYNDGYWGPAPVGSFKLNPFNLNDIAGNVMEWVDDCWHDSYTRAPKNGASWANPGCDSHVIRGGSWSSAPAEFEPSHRFKAKANFNDPRVGFRIALNLL